jgi:hypothetical protein
VTDRMLTTDEFADLFRIDRSTANRWAKVYPRQLGAVKLTPRGQWRWPEGKALAALAKGLSDETREVAV